jgi:hypothetical protein
VLCEISRGALQLSYDRVAGHFSNAVLSHHLRRCTFTWYLTLSCIVLLLLLCRELTGSIVYYCGLVTNTCMKIEVLIDFKVQLL